MVEEMEEIIAQISGVFPATVPCWLEGTTTLILSIPARRNTLKAMADVELYILDDLLDCGDAL